MKIAVGEIERDGKITKLYLCNREKPKCKNSILCGKECKVTFDENYAVDTDEATIIRKE